MTQSERLCSVLKSLDVLTTQFIQSLSDEELKRLKASLECKSLMTSKISKERIHCKTHLKPESKG